MEKILLFLLSVVLATASCTREKGNEGVPEPPIEKEVEISLYHSDEADTRGVVLEESSVISLDLLVFKADKFLYWRSAYKIENKFRATLAVESGLDIHFIANARQLITDLHDQNQLTSDSSWEQIRLKLLDTDPDRLVYTNPSQISLPMWGMLNNKDVKDVPINNWGTVRLLRSVASVDVEVSPAVADSKFTLEDMRLYFVPANGFLAPSTGNFNASEMAVLAPESPAGMKTTLTLFSAGYDAASKSIANKLYLYDNDTDEFNRTLLPDTDRRHTRVVVGGKYEGTKYYYPIDFETENDELDQVTRNWKYIFQINSATSRGYSDPDEASVEPAIGLNVSIVKWTEKLEGDFYVSGPYYVGITWDPYWVREVLLERPAGSTRLVGLRSNIKAEVISLEFSSESVNGPSEDVTGGIKNARFSVEKKADGNGYITGLLFTALKDHDTMDPNSNLDKLIVASGRIQFEIPITQLSSGSNDWDDGGNKNTDLQ